MNGSFLFNEVLNFVFLISPIRAVSFTIIALCFQFCKIRIPYSPCYVFCLQLGLPADEGVLCEGPGHSQALVRAMILESPEGLVKNIYCQVLVPEFLIP